MLSVLKTTSSALYIEKLYFEAEIALKSEIIAAIFPEKLM